MKRVWPALTLTLDHEGEGAADLFCDGPSTSFPTINFICLLLQRNNNLQSCRFVIPSHPSSPERTAVAKPNTHLYDPADLAIAANYSHNFKQQLSTCASLVAFHCAPIIDSAIDDSLRQTTPAGNPHIKDTSSARFASPRSPMSRAQHDTHLLGLVDSDSEDGLSGPASTRFGSSKPATKTKPTSTITKPKSILKQTTTAAIIKKEPVNKPTAASTAKRATPKTATTTTTTKAATTTRQQSASGAGASTMAPAKRKTASTPSVANKRTAATTAVTASANKVIKASAQKTKPLTARQKAALARAALAESSGNVTATPSTVGKATRASGRGKRAAAAMAPVEEEEMESTEQTETILEEDTTMHDVTVTEEVEEAPKETTTRATRGRPRKTAVAETPVPATATATRGGRGRKKKVEELVVVEEDETTTTQQEEMTEEITHEETQIEEEEEESLPIPGAWRNGPAPASTSRKSSSLGLGFKAHTATGRNDDVELRRKLGEMTQKYEALELKYRDLKEVAVKEAERNFDKLRKHSEERTAGMFMSSYFLLETYWVIVANKPHYSLWPTNRCPQRRALLEKGSRQRDHPSPKAT